MTFYKVFFQDGTWEQIVLQAMASEQFRLANGGESNAQLALKQAREKFPGRTPIRLERSMTGRVEWQA